MRVYVFRGMKGSISGDMMYFHDMDIRNNQVPKSIGCYCLV